jgi:hypothetical protein
MTTKGICRHCAGIGPCSTHGRKKAKQRTRPVTVADEMRIESAITHLSDARECLRLAQAGNAANYVARAIKSTQGALRHARARLDRGRTFITEANK